MQDITGTLSDAGLAEPDIDDTDDTDGTDDNIDTDADESQGWELLSKIHVKLHVS